MYLNVFYNYCLDLTDVFSDYLWNLCQALALKRFETQRFDRLFLILLHILKMSYMPACLPAPFHKPYLSLGKQCFWAQAVCKILSQSDWFSEDWGKTNGQCCVTVFTNSESPVLLLHFDHISDLSVLHDSVTPVKMICMVIGRSRNANLLLYCCRALNLQYPQLI